MEIFWFWFVFRTFFFFFFCAHQCHIFVFSPKVETNHSSSQSQSKSDSVQFAFSEDDGDNGPVPGQLGLALNAKRFSTVKITEIGDSHITENDSVVFADPPSSSDASAQFPRHVPLSVSERNRLFRRNVSFSGVRSGPMYLDNFGDEERVEGGSDVNSMSTQPVWYQRSISYDAASSPKKYLLPFEEGSSVDHDYQFKVSTCCPLKRGARWTRTISSR